ncbi:hypothetical protein C0993_008579 [Termitomyces sp. T159_Od127]|nr:hypothetical protein C0993_008579 [Termitomyces sp. T159_Od127]
MAVTHVKHKKSIYIEIDSGKFDNEQPHNGHLPALKQLLTSGPVYYNVSSSFKELPQPPRKKITPAVSTKSDHNSFTAGKKGTSNPQVTPSDANEDHVESTHPKTEQDIDPPTTCAKMFLPSQRMTSVLSSVQAAVRPGNVTKSFPPSKPGHSTASESALVDSSKNSMLPPLPPQMAAFVHNGVQAAAHSTTHDSIDSTTLSDAAADNGKN